MVCLCPDSNGHQANQFVNAAFQECKYTSFDIAQFIFGWISLFFWIVTNYPQVRDQFITKQACGMSWGFVFCWLGGDSLNLISTFLLDLLLTQKVLAVFWVTMDTFLAIQQISFMKSKGTGYSTRIDYKEAIIYILGFIFVSSIIIELGVLQGQLLLSQPEKYQPCTSAAISNGRTIGGNVLAYMAVPLYIATRPFQIALNYRRKSVDGLNIVMFFFTIGANGAQFIQLCLQSISIRLYFPEQIKENLNQIPFYLGSLGPVLLDIVILSQAYYYKKVYIKKHPKKIDPEQNENHLEDTHQTDVQAQ